MSRFVLARFAYLPCCLPLPYIIRFDLPTRNYQAPRKLRNCKASFPEHQSPIFVACVWVHHTFLQHYIDLESAKAILNNPRKNKQTGRFIPLMTEFVSSNFLPNTIPYFCLFRFFYIACRLETLCPVPGCK
jgi:hypothetical protein